MHAVQHSVRPRRAQLAVLLRRCCASCCWQRRSPCGATATRKGGAQWLRLRHHTRGRRRRRVCAARCGWCAAPRQRRTSWRCRCAVRCGRRAPVARPSSWMLRSTPRAQPRDSRHCRGCSRRRLQSRETAAPSADGFAVCAEVPRLRAHGDSARLLARATHSAVQPRCERAAHAARWGLRVRCWRVRFCRSNCRATARCVCRALRTCVRVSARISRCTRSLQSV
jgi:hypothetical protein